MRARGLLRVTVDNRRMRVHKTPAYAVGLFVFVVIAAIAVSTALLIWNLRARELEHSRIETISLTQMFIEQTEQEFSSTEMLLSNIQEKLQDPFGSQLALDGMGVRLLMNSRLGGSRQIRSLFIVNADGLIINTTKDIGSAAINVADRNYFKFFENGQSNRIYIDKPVRNRFDNTWSLHLSKGLVDQHGKFRGVIVASMDIPSFEQLYNFMKLDYLRPIAIYLNDGTLVASLPHRENMIGEKVPELTLAEIAMGSVEVTMIQHRSGDGGHQLFALGKLEKFPILVSVTNDDEQALASWRETAIPIGIGSAGTCLFILLVAGFLVRELIRENELSLQLRDATDRYHHTIDSVMDAIVAVDEHQNILLFNPAAEVMFGYKAQDIIGQPLRTLIPDRFRTGHGAHVEGFMSSPVLSRTMSLRPQLEITGKRRDGSEFPIESTISKTTIGNTKQLTAVLRDATERRRAETALYQTNQQLRELSASLEKVREEERTRISRELHDDLGQQLTGLKLDMSWFANRLKDGRGIDPDKVADMRRALDVAVSSVRRISTELRPLVLDDLGFVDALKWHVADLAKRSGLNVSLNFSDAEMHLVDDVATALFRIVQESLNNIVKHAQAQHVFINLDSSGSQLSLTIQDDGKGFDTDTPSSGLGLISMRERALALAGAFSVVSNDERGVTVCIEIPMHNAVLQEMQL